MSEGRAQAQAVLRQEQRRAFDCLRRAEAERSNTVTTIGKSKGPGSTRASKTGIKIRFEEAYSELGYVEEGIISSSTTSDGALLAKC
jgi:hypothetical protein